MTAQMALFVFMAASPCSPPAEVKPNVTTPETGVQGRVVSADGTPVGGVKVTVSMRDGPHRSFTAATVSSGKDGTFSIRLRPGEFDFVAVIQGDQAARTKPFALRAGQAKDVGILKLAPIGPPAIPDVRKPK